MATTKNDPVQTLTNLAIDAQSKSYSPYSKFKVGAAIQTSSGQYYAGCNVENASYPESQCAEATAIGNMISQGDSHIEQVVIVSPNENPLPPCGGCRQKLAEFSQPNTPIHLVTSEGDVTTYTMHELLPHGFGKDDLIDE